MSIAASPTGLGAIIHNPPHPDKSTTGLASALVLARYRNWQGGAGSHRSTRRDPAAQMQA
ncbi:MAG: hypothetical protein HPY83_01595 [Anaerolineae bacterium]|nr:hypothetical protein [Anaerolineae bacterium]